MRDVQVVEERAPTRVVVEHDVHEADQRLAIADDDGVPPGIGRAKSRRPHREPVGIDVAVEELIGVGAAIVPPPAVGVKGRDIGGVDSVGFRCESRPVVYVVDTAPPRHSR
jgi:hypothetical protein